MEIIASTTEAAIGHKKAEEFGLRWRLFLRDLEVPRLASFFSLWHYVRFSSISLVNSEVIEKWIETDSELTTPVNLKLASPRSGVSFLVFTRTKKL